MANDLPSRIFVWRGYPMLDHIGTWATTRYPDEAMPYVPADRALPWRDQLDLAILGKMMDAPADFGRFETYWPIRYFITDEISYDIARAILRDMTDRNLCDYRSGLWDEEGPRGSGYGITEAGAKHYDDLKVCYSRVTGEIYAEATAAAWSVAARAASIHSENAEDEVRHLFPHDALKWIIGNDTAVIDRCVAKIKACAEKGDISHGAAQWCIDAIRASKGGK